MIITDLRDKIKRGWEKILPHEEAIWWLGLVVCGSLLGVGVYKLVMASSDLPPITIERGVDFRKIYSTENTDNRPVDSNRVAFSPNSEQDSGITNKMLSEKIVASKNGTRYYYEHCAGVKRIKESNKIYFDNEAEAKTKGLTLAANCQ